jgi:hypothetical protein
MPVQGALSKITQAVSAWEGMHPEPHRFGGIEYCLGRREVGHVHGDSLVDIPFPVKVRNEIVQSGEAQAHHLLSESGWVSIYLHRSEDVDRAIQLLRRSYDLAIQQKMRRQSG